MRRLVFVSRLRKATATVLAVLTLGALSVSTAQPAAADDGDWYEAKILKVLSKSPGVNYNKKLPNHCNLPCTLSAQTSVTRTVGLTAGLTWKAATAKLGISNSKTKSVTVSCSALKTASHYYLVAYAEGYTYQYRVEQKTYDAFGALKRTEQMTLVAFDPTGAHCVAE